MKTIFFLFLSLVIISAVTAQDYDFEPPPVPQVYINPNVPTVKFEAARPFLLRALYPLYYENEYQIRRDRRYVGRNDSTLTAWWDSLGTYILSEITRLSGIDWTEKNLDFQLAKYAPTAGMYDPLIMPLEGVKTRDYIEVAPVGLHRSLNVIRLLCGRNLRQMFSQNSAWFYLSDHPLLAESAYRFDVINLTLTVAVAEKFIPPDSLKNIFKTGTWRRINPAWEVYDSHFRYNWPLTPETPLVTYLSNEPYNSPLVGMTTPPRPAPKIASGTGDADKMKLGAGTGRLGFSVARGQHGLLEVVAVDSTRLAFANGLMVGDLVKRVNGQTARNARQLMTAILDKIDTDGVYMIIVREDEEIGLLLLPVEEFEEEDDYYYYEILESQKSDS